MLPRASTRASHKDENHEHRQAACKGSTHYLNDTNRFDVLSKGRSLGISVAVLLLVDVVIRYLHWLRIEENHERPLDIMKDEFALALYVRIYGVSRDYRVMLRLTARLAWIRIVRVRVSLK